MTSNMDVIQSSKKSSKHQELVKEASPQAAKITSASKEIEKNLESSIQPPPPPPLPFNSDFFKSAVNPEIFRSKFRKSLPRDTDEETTRSFDAVVNELKSKFTKIKENLDNSNHSDKTYKRGETTKINNIEKKNSISKQQFTTSSNSIGLMAANASKIEESSKSLSNIVHGIKIKESINQRFPHVLIAENSKNGKL
jgi:hypothetical protein